MTIDRRIVSAFEAENGFLLEPHPVVRAPMGSRSHVLRMGSEFIATGTLQVYRTTDADELKIIKRGGWTRARCSSSSTADSSAATHRTVRENPRRLDEVRT